MLGTPCQDQTSGLIGTAGGGHREAARFTERREERMRKGVGEMKSLHTQQLLIHLLSAIFCLSVYSISLSWLSAPFICSLLLLLCRCRRTERGTGLRSPPSLTLIIADGRILLKHTHFLLPPPWVLCHNRDKWETGKGPCSLEICG